MNYNFCSPLIHLCLGLIFLPALIFGQTTITIGKNSNEPTVVLSPKNSSNQIIAAANVDRIFYLEKEATHFKAIQGKSQLGVYGDPVLHYADSNLFYAHLSKTTHKKYGDWFDRIVVQKIHALSPWEETSYSVGYNPPKMQDKPWLSSDNHSTKFKGNVYVTWTEFDKYGSKDSSDFSRIRFSKYIPNTDSFSTAITISDTVGDCLDGDNTLEGATTAVGSNGEIYAVWAGHQKIWFDKSIDGGNSWGADQQIATQFEGWDMDMPNIFRANGMPFIQCDTIREIMYITWADEENGNADVWLIFSKDKGISWSKKIRISEAKGHQYFPNIVLNQQSGDVYIAYYDQSLSSKSLFYDISLNRFNLENPSRNELFRITPKSIPLPGKNYFYGDYIDIDYLDNNLAVIYPKFDNKNSSIDMFLCEIDKLTKINKTNKISHSLTRKENEIQWAVNIQKSCTISYKIKPHKGFKFRLNRIKETRSLNEINHDFILYIGPNHGSARVRYVIKDKEDQHIIDQFKGKIKDIKY